ncbi:MAG: YggT family protein [Candidatus Baltobacteraceae bacterium]
MSLLSCEVWALLYWVLRLFWLAMLLYALVSWVPSLQGRWSQYLARIVEPVLLPLRRIIPPLGGFDLSFLVVIILVGVVMNQIPGAGDFQYCSSFN